VASPGKGVGGLPPRRIDQQPVPPAAAVQPGATSTVRARTVIISGSGAGVGVFVYDGTPGAGNPPVVSITSASADPYGNAVEPGLEVSEGLILFYTGTPAAGNLAASIAGTAGTDDFGNAYPAGIAAYNSNDTYYALLGNTAFSSTMQLIFQNIADNFDSPPFVEAFGSGSAGATLELNSGESGGASGASGIVLQDTTAAGRPNGLVTIVSGGLSGPALLSSTDSFQGPLTLPLPHQTTANDNISGTAGSLSAADRTSINGLINAVNTLQTNLQASGLELT
jgi:hypothetical protein